MKLSENRLAVAALLIPVLYLLITALTPFFFSLLVTAAILRAQYEFYKLYYQQEPPPAVYLGLILGFLLSCQFYFNAPLSFGILFVLILMVILVFHLFFFRQIPLSLADSAVLFMGVFYLAGFLGYLIPIRQMAEGAGFILFLLSVVWGGDAGAYYVGRRIGGKKLYPAVSPNKTVSGSIGGLLASLLGGSLAKLFFLPVLPWGEMVVLSLFLGGAGQLGDLVESMFKRSGGVKDSSGLIPAHGGALDKLDGVAFAAPLLYYCLVWIKG